MQTIMNCLWFNGNAEEAANLYTSVFRNSKVTSIVRNVPGGPGKPGDVLTINFTIDGQEFMGLNGGPQFPFTEAISLVVRCETQQEIDTYWDKLTADGGAPVECGWLKDKFGLRWQIVPSVLSTLLADKDVARVERTLKAVWGMKKLDIKAIKQAHAGA